MSTGSLCIGLIDPAFLAAFGLGLIGALALAFGMGRLEPRVDRHEISVRERNLRWFAAMVATWLGPILLLFLFFRWVHPGQTLCTAIVGNWFFLLPAVLLVTGALFGVRERKRALLGQ
jgi:hypothetical protein